MLPNGALTSLKSWDVLVWCCPAQLQWSSRRDGLPLGVSYSTFSFVLEDKGIHRWTDWTVSAGWWGGIYPDATSQRMFLLQQVSRAWPWWGSTVCGGIMSGIVGENDWKTISRGPETADIRGNNHRKKLYGKEDGERTVGEWGAWRPSWWPTKDGERHTEADVAASHTEFTFGHDLSSLGMWHNGILSGFRGI